VGSRQHLGSSVVDRVKVDAIDPSKLGQPAVPAPAPAQPETAPQPTVPGPLQAPTPQLRNPFGAQPQDPAAPANP
jgi:preprotein translocase subunit SecG